MSRKHPVIAVTGSSGAGTTTVKRAFENIFRREKITAAVIEGDSLHSLDRMAFRAAAAEAAKAQASGGDAGAAQGEAKKDEGDVVDAEFTEVKNDKK